MPTINLGRIKPVWRGYWSAGTNYVKDDMVRFDVHSYICTSAHTSGSSFSTGAGWELMMEGSTIPSQAGNANKVLKTNGTSMSWGIPGASTLLWSQSSSSSGNTTATLSDNMDNYGFLLFRHSSWMNWQMIPVAIFKSKLNENQMLDSYDTSHSYVRYTGSSTSIYISSGTGPTAWEIWGIQ